MQIEWLITYKLSGTIRQNDVFILSYIILSRGTFSLTTKVRLYSLPIRSTLK